VCEPMASLKDPASSSPTRNLVSSTSDQCPPPAAFWQTARKATMGALRGSASMRAWQ
jgi:hypothetical protein